MKQLICELCESSDFLRKEEGFLCRSCGCTYTLEQARKMMRDVPDAAPEAPAAAVIAAQAALVSVMESYVPTASEQARYEKYLFVARRARLENNAAEAQKYYDLAMAEDPGNLEAGFFNSYYTVMETKMLNLDGVLPAFQNRARSTIAKLLAEPEGMICHAEIQEYLSYTHEMMDMIVSVKMKELVEVTDKILEYFKLALQQILNKYIVNPYNIDELTAKSNALSVAIVGCMELELELYQLWNDKAPHVAGMEKLELLHKYDQTRCRLQDRMPTGSLEVALKIEELMRQIDPDAKSDAVERLWRDALVDAKKEKPSDNYRNAKRKIAQQRAATYWAAHPEEKAELEARLESRRNEQREEEPASCRKRRKKRSCILCCGAWRSTCKAWACSSSGKSRSSTNASAVFGASWPLRASSSRTPSGARITASSSSRRNAPASRSRSITANKGI